MLKRHALSIFLLFFVFGIESKASERSERIGVFFGSYGDVDGSDEVRDLVVNTLTDPDVLPIGPWFRKIVAEVGYHLEKDSILDEYEAIGGRTEFRRNSERQAISVAEALREHGLNAHGYYGFTMTFPYVREALSAAQSDGITRLVVFYQGAQYSQPTAFILFRHVEEYLAAHPEWNVEVIGVKSFSNDPRFSEQLIQNISKTWETSFPDANPEDVCLFLPVHGNVVAWEKRGDPYRQQIMQAVKNIRRVYSKSYVAFGFQNHDEIPLVRWTRPSWQQAIDTIAQRKCSKVIATGQISFTVDSLETIYDHAVAAPLRLEQKSRELSQPKQYALVPMFNANEEFVEVLRDISIDALNGKGDLLKLGTDELKCLDLSP